MPKMRRPPLDAALSADMIFHVAAQVADYWAVLETAGGRV